MCLFGLTLTPNAYSGTIEFTERDRGQEFIDEFDRCKGKSRKNKTKMRERKNCFGSLARTAATEDLGIAWDKVQTNRMQLRKDFKKCKIKICENLSSTQLGDDWCSKGKAGDIDEDLGTETNWVGRGLSKNQIKDAMHCYAAIAREVYDILSD